VQWLAVSSPVFRSPCFALCFAPYLAADIAQVTELVVIECGKCTSALVAVQPPAPEFRCRPAAFADVGRGIRR
jgi:hypothetical protein